MLMPVLLAVLTAAPSPQTPLEQALGLRLPQWGATPEQVETVHPQAREHRPHSCPNSNELLAPGARELRRPDLSVAGARVQFVDFLQGRDGLESVRIDFVGGQWLSTAGQLIGHLERSLGPPAKRRSGGLALWRLPTAVVVVTGTTILLADPRSPSAEELGAPLRERE